MKDDDFKLLRGFAHGRTDGRTDIGDCRVAFATENIVFRYESSQLQILRKELKNHCTELQVNT